MDHIIPFQTLTSKKHYSLSRVPLSFFKCASTAYIWVFFVFKCKIRRDIHICYYYRPIYIYITRYFDCAKLDAYSCTHACEIIVLPLDRPLLMMWEKVLDFLLFVSVFLTKKKKKRERKRRAFSQ